MISKEKFKSLLLEICSSDTSSDPENWSLNNRLYGNCAPIVLLAQDLFKGEIFKISLEGTKYSKLHSHFLNMISGEFVDFSREQFQDNISYNLNDAVIRNRDHIISQGDTHKRYNILKQRFLDKNNL